MDNQYICAADEFGTECQKLYDGVHRLSIQDFLLKWDGEKSFSPSDWYFFQDRIFKGIPYHGSRFDGGERKYWATGKWTTSAHLSVFWPTSAI